MVTMDGIKRCLADGDPRMMFNREAVTFLVDRVQFLEHLLSSHGPEGHNVTNQQFVEMRDRVRELEASSPWMVCTVCGTEVSKRDWEAVRSYVPKSEPILCRGCRAPGKWEYAVRYWKQRAKHAGSLLAALKRLLSLGPYGDADEWNAAVDDAMAAVQQAERSRVDASV